DGTAGFFLRQLDQARASKVDWHRYFQGYLMGRDQSNLDVLAGAAPWSSEYLYTLLSLPADFASGFLGMYFIQPVAGWPRWLRALWKAAILIGCGVVVVAVARSWVALCARRAMGLLSPGGLQARYIVLGATAALAIPVYLLLLGQFWAAGKAVSMLSP